MHPVSKVIIAIESLFLLLDGYNYLNRPHERKRIWQLILLILVIFRNIVEGLFYYPKESWPIPLLFQNFLGQGFCYLVASYFPFYWYKLLDIKELKFHGSYGFLFLLIPTVLVYGIFFPFFKDINAARMYVYIIPCIYGFALTTHAIHATTKQYKEDRNKSHKTSRVVILFAIAPWLLAPILGLGLSQPQWVVDIALNTGFLALNFLFLRQVVKQSRGDSFRMKDLEKQSKADSVKIKDLETKVELHRFNMKVNLSQEKKLKKATSITPIVSPVLNLGSHNKPRRDTKLFDQACEHYGFSPREIQIVTFLKEGLRRKEISKKLNIGVKTVESDITSIYKKVEIKESEGGRSKKEMLLKKLVEISEEPSNLPPLGAN